MKTMEEIFKTMTKTAVITTSKDAKHNEWEESEKGYIDGYVRGGDGVPYAVVVVEQRLVMIPLNVLKVIHPLLL